MNVLKVYLDEHDVLKKVNVDSESSTIAGVEYNAVDGTIEIIVKTTTDHEFARKVAKEFQAELRKLNI